MVFVSKELIDKGWSGDKKYKVTTADGKTYLYRVSPMEQYERKRQEYEYQKKVSELGIPMCLPIEFGQNEEGVYSLQNFIFGKDAEDAIKEIDEEKVYSYGLDAGRILKKIHSMKAPDNAPDWAERFNAKIDRKLKMYAECPLKYENGDYFIKFIASHRHLLSARPQSYQHGDYHIGNMMIGDDGVLYVIDFNRCDVGDPWEEFNRIVWCAQASPLFASGMVDGYFDGEPPMEFWELLALYIASNTLSSLPWAIPFGEKEIRTMKNQAKEVLEWYDNMKNPVPRWYGKGGKDEIS
jgi:aminoglycoside phosphotransferase (APT) family kinase protein